MSEEDEQTAASKTQENSSSEDNHDNVSSYEKQRLRRIQENNDRMAALGLRNLASKLTPAPVQNQGRKKLTSKGKLVDEEEYTPCDDDDGDDGDDYDDEDFAGVKGTRSRKVTKNSKSKKKITHQKLFSATDVIDDDTELMQAIALSLKDSELAKNPDNGPSHIGSKKIKDTISIRNNNIEKDTGKRKRNQPQVRSREQMNEDELIMHFFQFDA